MAAQNFKKRSGTNTAKAPGRAGKRGGEPKRGTGQAPRPTKSGPTGQRRADGPRIGVSGARTAAPTQRRRPARAKSEPAEPRKGERLQKILASAGVAARRSCEQIILEGRVQVNGVTVTQLGAKADPMKDEITFDFVPIQKEKPIYILLNKPKGYVTTVRDNEGRPTVMALLGGISARVFPVGRLDFNSEGILLMTNDGELAQHLASPSSHVSKTYLVKVHRLPRPETLDELRAGFRLSGRRLRPCQIQFADRQSNPWLKITLTEGKNQQIRKMFAAVGHPVHKLKRVQFGPLADPALKPGQWRLLTPDELAMLKNMYG